MKVMLTGGTGFVGSHAVEALLAAGHQLRLLVRDRERLERSFGARGIPIPEVVLGDMGDEAAVADALEGCDAVVHAAASVQIGRGKEIFENNVAGVRQVLGQARKRGLDPIVYVSSVSVMFPPLRDVITANDPVTSLDTAYGRSKVEGERYARELQAEGVPLVSFYPAGVMGPHDPAFGAGSQGLRDRVRYGWPMTTGGVCSIDVRDLALAITAAIQPGRGPRRLLAGGHFLTWRAESDLFEGLLGRKVRRLPAPAAIVRGVGHLVDLLQRLVPGFDYPLTHEAAQVVTQFVRCDDADTREELGLAWRPSKETARDTLCWMLQEGWLEPRHAPALASESRSASA
jgi:nucleoside-diphosphate-sugar epimerase